MLKEIITNKASHEIGGFKIALLLSYICIASISAAIITPALPQIEQTYSLGDGALEWVISIFLLGYVIGQLIYGPLANRFGTLNSLRSGLVINLLGISICFISILAFDYNLLLIGRLVTALGSACGLTCTFILINELLSKKQAKHAMSYAVISFTGGVGLAVIAGGLITQYLHWYDCFIFLSVHGIIMLGLTWIFPKTNGKSISLHPLNILSGYLAALKSSDLIIFSITVGVQSTLAYCFSAAAPIYSQSVLHLSPSSYGYWNIINMFGMLSSGFLSAYLVKCYGPKRVLLSGLILCVPGLTSLVLIATTNSSNTLWFFLTTMFLYLFSGLLFPSASYFASNAIEDKANASSMMSFINMGSAMATVIIMGYLPLTSIWAFALTVSGFFILAASLVLTRMNRDIMQSEPSIDEKISK